MLILKKLHNHAAPFESKTVSGSKTKSMKPVLMRHVETTTESFKAWKNANPYLHNPWHYHPELEITVIIKGSGVLFVGDKIINYGENELFLIGSNLTHEWRSDIKTPLDNYSQSIAVHFMKNF